MNASFRSTATVIALTAAALAAPSLAHAKRLLTDYVEPKLDEGIDEALRDYIARREHEIPAEDALNTEY